MTSKSNTSKNSLRYSMTLKDRKILKCLNARHYQSFMMLHQDKEVMLEVKEAMALPEVEVATEIAEEDKDMVTQAAMVATGKVVAAAVVHQEEIKMHLCSSVIWITTWIKGQLNQCSNLKE